MSRFDKACEEWRTDLIALVTELKTQIGDDLLIQLAIFGEEKYA